MTLAPPPEPRRFGAVNWIGLLTLCLKEIRRFGKVLSQTIVAPVVTTLLFLAIFSLAFGGAQRTVGGIPFSEFLVPGLVMMAIMQNAFANTSSSIIISKMQGNIVDVLMPPLSAGELTLGFAVGGIARGLVVGVAVAAATALFVPLHLQHWGFVLYHALAAATLLSLLGMIAGIWADRFDHIAAVTNFVVTPLAFLSGTFYSIERLPALWQIVARLNPFFYMIDGFRYGFIGSAEGSLAGGIAVLLGADVALAWACHRMIARGYKLKA